MSGKRFGRMIGDSAPMQRLFAIGEKLAQTSISVVLEGETGTGKELLAQSLHENGTRSAGPFVVFDCSTVAPGHAETELFGREQGSDGGIAGHPGPFEVACGGTLVLDHVADLDAAVQPKLLRVLERREVKRVGSDRPIPIDVRIMCTSRSSLHGEVHEGRLREDLFHRIAVARLELPPVRERHGDVRPLVGALCVQLGRWGAAIPPELLEHWERSPWPGNVRELRNAVARYLALGEFAAYCGFEPACERHPSDPPSGERPTTIATVDDLLARDLPFSMARQTLLDEFERRYVERVLSANGGNVLRAAAASGVARRHFQRLKARSAR